MSINISQLWDYNNPDLSEERFRLVLLTASAEDSLILQTQIARTYGIRKNFSQAQKILTDIQPQIQNASLETKSHYYLELGRTYCSATHPPESQSAEVIELARSAYMQALKFSQEGNLDNLTIDALHMLAFVDTSPEDQISWNRKALALMNASSQQNAKKWEGSLHNNIGYALYTLKQYEDALSEFKLALVAYERNENPQSVRIAKWMIAWTYRALNCLNEALEIQLQLEMECDEAGEPDVYVFEELELMYLANNNKERADFYAARRKSII